ncbi:CUB and sushi domain-containing protein 2, partial [Geodia barretti]
TAFTFGSVATYSCSAGCQPVGPSTRLCEADGTWSGLPPLCPVINCGTLSNPANGVVQFLSSSTAGGEVVYVCDSGYEVVGD